MRFWLSAHGILLLVCALSAPPADAAGTRYSTIGPFLEPGSATEVARIRALKASIDPNSPQARIESGVADRVRLLSTALGSKRQIVTDVEGAYSSPGLPVDETGRLYVRIDGAGIAGHVADLRALRVEPVAVAGAYDFLEAWVPWDAVTNVASLGYVRRVGVPGMAIAEIGASLTQGDMIHRANLARSTFSIDGTGARVGVISDGVSNLASAQGSSDLGAVSVGNTGSGDEGTAMLEIVHDLAPGATLAFYTAGGGSASMITAQNWLANTALSNVIVDDIWLPREPYFEDGPVSQNAASLTTSKDLVYITSAGNRAQRHVNQDYKDGGSQQLGTVGQFRPHDWANGDYLLNVRLQNPQALGVRHTIVLQWTEPYGAAARDFDLYLLDAGLNNVIASSTSSQNGAGDPFEILDFTWNGPNNTPAYLVVDYAGPLPVPANIMLKIAANGPTFPEYVTPAGSINPHAGNPLVFATGAINAADPGNDVQEGFSSQGPFTRLFPTNQFRNKPDAMGVDGVQVTGAGGFPTPFFGTSAAAPHAAGLAALLRGAVPALTAAEVRDAMRETAVDILAPGFDFQSGAGRLDALALVSKFLNQPPVADAGNDTTVECKGATTNVQLDGSRSYDPDNDPITYTWSATNITFDDAHAVKPTGGFPLGTTTVTLTVSDGQFEDTDEVDVTVEDTTPPTVTVTLDPALLWPPNHKLADIHATVVAEDSCDATLTVRLLPITSNEPDNGLGDGDEPDDIQDADYGQADYDFRLRSERQGPGETRVYTVCYEAEDGSGNIGSGCATVTVTHDQALEAFYTPVDANEWSRGGWLDLAAAGDVSQDELAAVTPDLRGDGFAATAPISPDQQPGGIQFEGAPDRVRWLVTGDDLRSLFVGAENSNVYARLVVDGVGYLAQTFVPNVPAATLAQLSSAAIAPKAGTDGAAKPVAAALPTKLELSVTNPVRAGGTVTFGLPQAGRVSVRLVSATGRVVARLAEGERPAGWQNVVLPTSLATGVYLVDVRTADAAARTKILVLR